MAKFNVGISGAEDTNRGANFNMIVDAANVADALKKAEVELDKVLEAGGLQLKPTAPATTPAA